MKRKGGSAVGQQKDSCDVWLDPSALKRRKMMNIATKPPFTPLGQNFYPATIMGPPHPRTKQTSISTFFTAQKAGDKTTDPSKGLTTATSNVNLKDSDLLRGKGTRASVLQPSSLQDCQRQPAKATDISGPFLCSSPGQSNTSSPLVAREEDAVTERGSLLTTDLTQPLEGKRGPQQQLSAGSPLREKNDGWQKEESPTFFSERCPSVKLIPNQRMDAGKRRRPPSSWAGATFVDDSENRDPELEGNLPAAAHLDFNLTWLKPGFCRKYTDATSCENSVLASTQRLFTQDSEGYRVILHRRGEGRKPSLPKDPWGSKGTPVGSSFEKKSCFREGWAGDRRPPGSLGRRDGVPPVTQRSEKSCYDLLFTEDSEGNRVIKH